MKIWILRVTDMISPLEMNSRLGDEKSHKRFEATRIEEDMKRTNVDTCNG